MAMGGLGLSKQREGGAVRGEEALAARKRGRKSEGASCFKSGEGVVGVGRRRPARAHPEARCATQASRARWARAGRGETLREGVRGGS